LTLTKAYDSLSLNNGDKPQKEGEMSKKGGYKGPRVTAKVIAMSESDRKAWLDSLKITPEERKTIAARLEKAVKKGIKPRKVNVESLKAALVGQPIDVLAEIQSVIAPLIEAGKADEIKRIREEIEAGKQKLATLEA